MLWIHEHEYCVNFNFILNVTFNSLLYVCIFEIYLYIFFLYYRGPCVRKLFTGLILYLPSQNKEHCIVLYCIEPQASESTRKFDNVAAYLASICFLLFQKFGKRISNKHFDFQKETTNSTTRLRWLNTVLRAVSGNSRDDACFNLDKQTWERKK